MRSCRKAERERERERENEQRHRDKGLHLRYMFMKKNDLKHKEKWKIDSEKLHGLMTHWLHV